MQQKIWNKDFILLTLANFLICITYYSLISSLPIYLAESLHANKSAIGIIIASYFIASIIIRPFSGYALDKWGRKSIYLTALVIYSFLSCGYLAAFTIALMIVLRFAHGLSWGITTISGATVAVDIVPDSKRGEGIGYYSLSTTLGMAVGPIIGLFVCHHWGYQALFISVLLFAVTGLICASFIRFPKFIALEQNKHFSKKNIIEKKSLLPSFNLLVIMSTYGALLSFIALYGREIGVRNTSGFFTIFAIGIAASRLASGKVFDRKGPQNILSICISLLIIGFPLLAMVSNPIGFYCSSLVLGFGVGVVFPIFSAMVNNLAQVERRGAANSTLYTFLDTGMGIGMVVMGIISQQTSIRTGFLVCAVVNILGLIFFRGWVNGYYYKNKINVQPAKE
jgi:MFS family permease